MEENKNNNLSRLDKNNNYTPKTEKVKKGFSALQKTIAFVGSILSVIIASFTINNNLNSNKTQNDQKNSTEIVKVVEKSSDQTSSANNHETVPGLGGNSKNHEINNSNNHNQTEPNTKETVVREIIREREIPETKKEQKENTETKKEGSVTEKKENKVTSDVVENSSSASKVKEDNINTETKSDLASENKVNQ